MEDLRSRPAAKVSGEAVTIQKIEADVFLVFGVRVFVRGATNYKVFGLDDVDKEQKPVTVKDLRNIVQPCLGNKPFSVIMGNGLEAPDDFHLKFVTDSYSKVTM